MAKIDVFISHSHKDKAVADAICHYFENDGIKCWIAPRDITPGSSWAGEITRAIPKCRILLLIFSSNSNISHQVLREVELAVKNKLIIMPVKIEDIKPTDDMEYFLSTLHWIDVVNKKTEKYILNLTETVKGFLGLSEKKRILDTVNKDSKNESDENEGSKVKTNLLKMWIPIAAAIILAVMGIVFWDSIFGNTPTSLESDSQPSESVEMTEAPTSEPTAEPTAAPTAEPTAVPTPVPTATVDPNIAPDTVVEIPDITLKSCVLKTLSDMGYPPEGNIITVEDMQRLKYIAVIRHENSAEEAQNSARDYIRNASMILKSDVGIDTLEGLQYATNLECLVMAGQGIEDISALSQIHNLKHVDLNGNKIEDISALAGHVNLVSLVLYNNSITDITPLMPLYNLSELFLPGNPINDISPIKGLFSLSALDIAGLPIENLEDISMLENLSFLSASGSNITDMSVFYNLVNLGDLMLHNSDSVTSVSFTNTMKHLSCFMVLGENITDPEEFLNIPNLEYLWVSDNVLKENMEIFDELERRGCVVNPGD